MKMISFNFNNILYYLILVLPLVLVKQFVVLGENVLSLLVIALEVVLICKRILENKGKKFIFRSYPIDKYICFFIMVYSLWKILSYSAGLFSTEIMDMEFYSTTLAATILYLLMDFQINVNRVWQKVAVIGGTIGNILILLTMIKGEAGKWLVDALTITEDGIISYLLLVNILSIANWILNRDENRWQKVWLLIVGFNMFVLLLKQSHISNWIVVFCLLTVASFFRPKASLIKKVGFLLFLFLFLWSNMSIVLNYTKIFSVEAIYSLENSVYMELLLAFGGLLYFHFWDRIPEGADLQKISMVKMQHYFRMFFGVILLVFLMFSMGGNIWNSLEEAGLKGFVKALALPLNSEITAGSSTMFQWLTKLGVMGTLMILIGLYQIGIRLYKRCGLDMEKANCFFIFYLTFLMQIFLWEVPGNVLFVFIFLISMGSVKPRLIETESEDEKIESKEN